MDRRTFLTGAASGAVLASVPAAAQAPSAPPTRAETLLIVQEYGPNSLDMQGIGAAQPVNGVSLNCYDRLVRFKTHHLAGRQPGLRPDAIGAGACGSPGRSPATA